MNPQTLKRQSEDVNFQNDDLNNDEYDVTWGGKRSRYIYNYIVQSPVLFSNSYDSDQTESIHSIQSKSTILVEDELDLSSVTSCGSDCDCNNSSQSILTEYEVVSSASSSSSYEVNCLNFSDSSTTSEEHQVLTNVKLCNDLISDTDNSGYLPDDTDTEVTLLKNNLPPPACFKNCLQCKRENLNPYFQYCFKCYRSRMELFEVKPDPKQKKIKSLNKLSNYKKEDNSNMDSQESSGSFGLSNLQLSQGKIDGSENNQIMKNDENIKNLCNVCFIRPKNGVFNHGKTSHAYSCYPCTKNIWNTTGRCPVCNIRVKHIAKIIIV